MVKLQTNCRQTGRAKLVPWLLCLMGQLLLVQTQALANNASPRTPHIPGQTTQTRTSDASDTAAPTRQTRQLTGTSSQAEEYAGLQFSLDSEAGDLSENATAEEELLLTEELLPLPESQIPADPSERVFIPTPSTQDLPVASSTVVVPGEEYVRFGDWLGYNATKQDTTWLWGNADEFGMFSMESYPSLDVGEDWSISFGSGFHFLNGPVNTDMPPRLFDFQTAFQFRKEFGSQLMIDSKFGVGAFSDFEGSARKGIRFPGHAIGYLQWDAWLVSVLGVEVLDRDDVSLLPVAGFVWRPTDEIIAELVFPRPRLQLRTAHDNAVYISGELGGGTWAIERADSTNDNATYRDLRLMLGVMEFDQEEHETALEIGWAFSRALKYRSGNGDYQIDDTFILRFRQHY